MEAIRTNNRCEALYNSSLSSKHVKSLFAMAIGLGDGVETTSGQFAFPKVETDPPWNHHYDDVYESCPYIPWNALTQPCNASIPRTGRETNSTRARRTDRLRKQNLQILLKKLCLF